MCKTIQFLLILNMKENEFTHKNVWKDNCLDCDKLKKTWFFFLKIEITNKNKITSNNHKKSSYDENNLVVILFLNSNIGVTVAFGVGVAELFSQHPAV